MIRRSIFLLCILLSIGMAQQALATHIVGGEITYTCREDPNSDGRYYKIKLVIYQDCLTGEKEAIAQDIPGWIGIFPANSSKPYILDTGSKVGITVVESNFRVPPNFQNDCVLSIPPTCLTRVTFEEEYLLPANSAGYRVVYQRCCRNASIINVRNPSAIGATFSAVIPPFACNNSAVFKQFPPQIICINNPLFYDNSATDIDGDSLSYEFCTGYTGGEPNDPKPYPRNVLVPLNYASPYTAAMPMLGNPVIKINPTTGMISGTPNQLGRFVVGVCCHEWRNGIRINTVQREFQFVVTSCSKAVVANIPQYSEEFNTYIVQCESNTVRFDNLSTGGETYSWDFDAANPGQFTSTEFQPTFTYPDTGTYIVKLVVNRGTTCPDSISRFVKVYPTFGGGLKVDGLPCPGQPIQFTDLSQSTYGPVTKWLWSFGDGTTSKEQNPAHSYAQGGLYTTTFISSNAKGCTDTVIKPIEIERFRPFAGNDTIIVKGESIQFRGRGGIAYEWSPGTYLNSTSIANPVGFFPDVTIITYGLFVTSESGCTGTDSIKVTVVNQGALFVPSAFSPNGDGLNDVLRPIGIGFRNINFFRVYNRYGEMMFNTNQFGEGWDGRNRGRDADVGTYFWVLSARNRFGQEEVIKGDAALLR